MISCELGGSDGAEMQRGCRATNRRSGGDPTLAGNELAVAGVLAGAAGGGAADCKEEDEQQDALAHGPMVMGVVRAASLSHSMFRVWPAVSSR